MAAEGVAVPAYKRAIRRVVPEVLRMRAWSALVATPGLAEVYARLEPSVRERRVTRDTDLVLDGFPRCANTYAVAAFEHANGAGRYRLSHHFHAPRSIERAVRFGLPTVVLIREPKGVLGSAVQFSEVYKPARILYSYRKFYERMLPIVDRVVVADFRETTSDFAAVIERCNAKFGTSFEPYVRTEESEEQVNAAIDHIAATHSPDRFEQQVSRPSANRRSADEIVAELNPRDRAALDEATALWERLLAAASSPQPAG